MKETLASTRELFSHIAHLAQIPALVILTAAAMLPAMSRAQDRTGKQVVDAVCSACHATGLNGAPRIGDKKAWSKRAAQGLSSLTQHALDGIRNMPAHGGQPNLSDLEIARAVTFMVNQSGGHWVAPINPNRFGKERTGEEVVMGQCERCHAKGLDGAPKIGDLQAWAPRIAHGMPYLVRSAIHGHGGMPPRGGEANLTDSELSAAILYMINPASAHPTAPAPQTPTSAMEPNHKIVDGIEIYLGYVTTASIRALPASSPEKTMHGGIPTGAGYYHVNVSLFNANTHAAINDAKVRMDFDWPAMAEKVVDMQRMPFEGGGSYGNYVKTEPSTPCTMTLHITRPGSDETTSATFEHTFE